MMESVYKRLLGPKGHSWTTDSGPRKNSERPDAVPVTRSHNQISPIAPLPLMSLRGCTFVSQAQDRLPHKEYGLQLAGDYGAFSKKN